MKILYNEIKKYEEIFPNGFRSFISLIGLTINNNSNFYAIDSTTESSTTIGIRFYPKYITYDYYLFSLVFTSSNTFVFNSNVSTGFNNIISTKNITTSSNISGVSIRNDEDIQIIISENENILFIGIIGYIYFLFHYLQYYNIPLLYATQMITMDKNIPNLSTSKRHNSIYRNTNSSVYSSRTLSDSAFVPYDTNIRLGTPLIYQISSVKYLEMMELYTRYMDNNNNQINLPYPLKDVYTSLYSQGITFYPGDIVNYNSDRYLYLGTDLLLQIKIEE